MKLRCFGCGGAVSSELPPETMVRALIICRECTAEAVIKVYRVAPFEPRSSIQEQAMRIVEPVPPPKPAPGPSPGEDPDELLRPKAAAALLQVSEAFLANCRWRGDGPRYVKPSSKTVRYRRADLRDWLAKREFGATLEEKRR